MNKLCKKYNTNLWAEILILAMFFVSSLSGCSVNVKPTLKQLEEPPPIPKINAKVGISIPEWVRSYKYGGEPTVSVDFGKSSSSRFIEAFQWLFADSIELASKEQWNRNEIKLDGVIELEALILEIKMGGDCGGLPRCNSPDTITAGYRICLYSSAGEIVNCWNTFADEIHQRHALEGFNHGEYLAPMLEKVVREAIAKFIVAFEDDQLVHEWSENFPGGSRDIATSPASIGPSKVDQIGILLWQPNEFTLNESQNVEESKESYTESSISSEETACEEYIVKGITEECVVDRVIASKKIRDILYPLVEPGAAPATEDDLVNLILEEKIKERLTNSGLKSLAVVYGTTREEADGHGLFWCGGTAAGAGCFGFAWGGEKSKVGVIIFDLQKSELNKHLTAASEGTSWIAGYILPIWNTAETEKHACKDLGKAIGKHLREQFGDSICR